MKTTISTSPTGTVDVINAPSIGNGGDRPHGAGRLAVGHGSGISFEDAPMKYLFEVHIKPGHTAEQYAAAWLQVSEILQRAPGARGTRLHRKLGDPSTLLAIASWESKAARDAMEARRDATVRSILQETSAFCEIAIIGEFDEPEWVVEPG